MRYSFFKNLVIVFSGAFLFIFSCTQEACFDETNAFLKASLYLDSSRKIQAPDSLTLYGAGMETSKIYNKATSLRVIHIPLNASSANCSFIMKINGITDTLTLWYSSSPHLISQVCGYTYYHNLDSVTVTNNIIDNITITLNTVTTFDGENIRIYY